MSCHSPCASEFLTEWRTLPADIMRLILHSHLDPASYLAVRLVCRDMARFRAQRYSSRRIYAAMFQHRSLMLQRWIQDICPWNQEPIMGLDYVDWVQDTLAKYIRLDGIDMYLSERDWFSSSDWFMSHTAAGFALHSRIDCLVRMRELNEQCTQHGAVFEAAVSHGNLETIRWWFANNTDVDEVHYVSHRVLPLFVVNNRLDLLKNHAELEWDPDLRDSHYFCALPLATPEYGDWLLQEYPDSVRLTGSPEAGSIILANDRIYTAQEFVGFWFGVLIGETVHVEICQDQQIAILQWCHNQGWPIDFAEMLQLYRGANELGIEPEDRVRLEGWLMSKISG
jgi:hypothetical protein